MTAIAYKDGVMAADTLATAAEAVRGNKYKIARSPRGMLAGCAGYAGSCDEFRRLVKSGKIDEWIDADFPAPLNCNDKTEYGFQAIIVKPDRNVICVDRCGRAVTMDAPFYCCGSAELIMIGAMAAGASAEEAVRIACQYDIGCGLPIQVALIDAHL